MSRGIKTQAKNEKIGDKKMTDTQDEQLIDEMDALTAKLYKIINDLKKENTYLKAGFDYYKAKSEDV